MGGNQFESERLVWSWGDRQAGLPGEKNVRRRRLAPAGADRDQTLGTGRFVKVRWAGRSNSRNGKTA
jgi:hypothetical protein